MTQFEAANRVDLADKEKEELAIIQRFMPQALSEAEVRALIAEALATTGATVVSDMGKVMAILKPQLHGRADMGQVGAWIKDSLSR